MRRDGKSLGQMVKEELNSPAGFIAVLAILAILVILLAVLALVVVKALAESPWGIFTVGATIPIALFMGGYMRFWRVGKVLEASAFGVALLLLAVWGGKLVYENPHWSQVFGLRDITLAWVIIGYGSSASSLPVWLLLAPRDYLSTFMKLGTIFALAFGILLRAARSANAGAHAVHRRLRPGRGRKSFSVLLHHHRLRRDFRFSLAHRQRHDAENHHARRATRGPSATARCAANRFVAIMALIAACTLEPGVYLSMNVKGDPAATVAKVTALGFPVTVDQMNALAHELGEKTLFGRTGGAATLAVGMAHIFSKAVNGRWLDLWYHFAIMFEALFILTTLDAGTRVGRYLIQDVLGRALETAGRPEKLSRHIRSPAALMVGAWGYFLIQGVRDPLGGINSLWPLFGIANQMLAAIALCLATTIILKMQLGAPASARRESRVNGTPGRSPALQNVRPRSR